HRPRPSARRPGGARPEPERRDRGLGRREPEDRPGDRADRGGPGQRRRPDPFRAGGGHLPGAMKKNEIAKVWPDFASAPQRALQMAAMLDRAPLPLDLVADTDRDLASAIAAGLVTVQEHDLWGWSLLVDEDLSSFLRGKDVPPLQEKDQKDLVRKVADSY